MKGKIEIPLDCGVHTKWFSAFAVEKGTIDTHCVLHDKRRFWRFQRKGKR